MLENYRAIRRDDDNVWRLLSTGRKLLVGGPLFHFLEAQSGAIGSPTVSIVMTKPVEYQLGVKAEDRIMRGLTEERWTRWEDEGKSGFILLKEAGG